MTRGAAHRGAREARGVLGDREATRHGPRLKRHGHSPFKTAIVPVQLPLVTPRPSADPGCIWFVSQLPDPWAQLRRVTLFRRSIDAVHARRVRGASPGVVAWTVSATLEATCCWRPCFCPELCLTLQKELGHMQNWDWCAICCHLRACCLMPESSSSSAASTTPPSQTVRGFGGPGLMGVRVDVAGMQAPPLPPPAPLTDALGVVRRAAVAPIPRQPSVCVLHRLHVGSPKGALTLCHNSSPSNLRQGTVFTRASKADHFLETLFKYLTRCARGA